MTYDGLSQPAPRLVRARPPHGSDLVVNDPTDGLFRALYEFGWNGGTAILDRPQPLWGTCRLPLRLAAPPCGSAAGSSTFLAQGNAIRGVWEMPGVRRQPYYRDFTGTI